MWINSKVGYLQDWITQVWVKATGRRIDPIKDSWLIGPIGDTRLIKDKFIHALAKKNDLSIIENPVNGGLIETFDDLGLSEEDKILLHPKVVHFYEQTSKYNFEIWSEWCGIFRPFGWLLSIIFSKRLQQLNLPLKPLDSARGLQSNLIMLIDRTTNKVKWTVWYRTLKSTNNVSYSGIYTTCEIPNQTGKFLKVIFPLPNGNASVIMKKEISKNGALKLSSDGKRFGDNGFYFTLTNSNGKYWGRFVKSMHEWI